MGRKRKPLNLSTKEKSALSKFQRDDKISHRARHRVEMLLRMHRGESSRSIASSLNITDRTVGNFLNRFLKDRLNSLEDHPRPGRPGQKRYKVKIGLTKEEMKELQRLASRRKTNQAIARRARTILSLDEGLSQTAIAKREGVSTFAVRRCRDRFIDHRLDGLQDAPRPGTPRKISDEDVERVIVKTLEEVPKNATHWSIKLTMNY